MMHNWFTCKIRFEKTLENGMNKKVTELYLVDALSFTEAESRIIEEMTPFISGEFEVSGVAKANYNELSRPKKEQPTAGLSANFGLSLSMRRAEQKNVLLSMHWYRHPICVMPSKSWTKA